MILKNTKPFITKIPPSSDVCYTDYTTVFKNGLGQSQSVSVVVTILTLERHRRDSSD